MSAGLALINVLWDGKGGAGKEHMHPYAPHVAACRHVLFYHVFLFAVLPCPAGTGPSHPCSSA